jgi:EAL domain-containing protein (putative c-di-GMP-specific phosphodiesterase class I)
MSVLLHSDFADRMYMQLPDHSVFAKMLVELDSIDIGRDPLIAKQIARQLEVYNVGITIGDVMAEPAWAGAGEFPVEELQVQSNLIHNCANDHAKRATCGMVMRLAERLGAQTVAKGIERKADFRAARDIGFDLGQGFLFGKPMDAQKFARTVLQRQPRTS